MDALNYFEKVIVVNLDRRPDRWSEFLRRLPGDWPFQHPERMSAIDGHSLTPPTWWHAGPGGWGCYRSHVRILEDCLARGVERVLILEDDAVFSPDFSERVQTFLAHTPDDWQMLYFGGQLLDTSSRPPTRINEHVFAAHNINRTHAYAFQGREFMMELYRYLHQWNGWTRGHHLDHHLGKFHGRQRQRVYVPCDWLVGQGAGRSDICGRDTHERYWPSPETSANLSRQYAKFVVVLGLHSSGSSAMAGVLHHLGVHLGNSLGGYYGKDPERSCGFEALGIARICEAAIPFPATGLRLPGNQISNALRQWINQRRREAVQRKTLAGCKYPTLCRLGNQMFGAVGPDLRVVHIDRPIEESIASLIRRCPGHDPQRLDEHQRWLGEGKKQFLSCVPSEARLEIQYSALLSDPEGVISQILSFLNIQPTIQQIARATAYVDRSRRHVFEVDAVA